MADDTEWSWFDTELDAKDYVDVLDEAVDDMYE